MTQYIIRRLFYVVLSAAVLSVVAFIIIQLPPGDFVTRFVYQMEQRGLVVDEAMMRALYQRFGFDRPLHEQYFKWIGNIVLRGDFGESMAFNAPVSELIGERSAEYRDVRTRIYDLHADKLWTIGVVGQAPAPLVVRNNLGNVPRELPASAEGMLTMNYYLNMVFFRS